MPVVTARRSVARLSAGLVAALLLVPVAATGAAAASGYVDEACRVTEYAWEGVEPGGAASVAFTVPEGCEDAIMLTLAAYEATSPTFTPDQVLVDHDSLEVTGGEEGTLHIDVPDCYYQLDFVYGPPIEDFAAEGTYSAAKRLISARNGGHQPCGHETPSEPEPTPSDTETVTPSPSPTVPEEPSPSETATASPSPTVPEEPSPSEAATATPSPTESDDDETGIGGDSPPTPSPSPEAVAVSAAPRGEAALAATGAPVAVLAGLALAGLGSGTTLLLRTRKPRQE